MYLLHRAKVLPLLSFHKKEKAFGIEMCTAAFETQEFSAIADFCNSSYPLYKAQKRLGGNW